MVGGVEPSRLAEAGAVLDKWELHHSVIGSVTDTGELRCFFRGDLEGAIPASFLTDECPRYEVEREPQPERPGRPVAAANHEGKAWIYEQYDQLVQSRTVRRPGLDAAILHLLPGERSRRPPLSAASGSSRTCGRPRRAGAPAIRCCSRRPATRRRSRRH